MTTYRDRLVEDYGNDIGSVVACGLDRLERPVSCSEITHAIEYYKQHKARLDTMAIGDRRQEITDLFR